MATAKKTATKRAPAKQANRTSVVKKAAGTKKVAAKKTPSKSSNTPASSHAPDDNYTDPALRDKIKAEVMAGSKGGRAGQWSARKAQLVAHEYEAAGGGYKHARTEAQQHLKEWGDEKWHTASGEQAIQGEETHRYLPDKAWHELTPAQKKATDRKKVEGSRKGKQFIPNTQPAKVARKHATE